MRGDLFVYTLKHAGTQRWRGCHLRHGEEEAVGGRTGLLRERAAGLAGFQMSLYGIHFVGFERTKSVGVNEVVNVFFLHGYSTHLVYASGH